jgi:hypothetical protein
MERPTGDDRVEGSACRELIKRHGLKELAFGSVRIDGDHFVA